MDETLTHQEEKLEKMRKVQAALAYLTAPCTTGPPVDAVDWAIRARSPYPCIFCKFAFETALRYVMHLSYEHMRELAFLHGKDPADFDHLPTLQELMVSSEFGPMGEAYCLAKYFGYLD